MTGKPSTAEGNRCKRRCFHTVFTPLSQTGPSPQLAWSVPGIAESEVLGLTRSQHSSVQSSDGRDKASSLAVSLARAAFVP